MWFDAWRAAIGKRYRSAEEATARRAVFESNAARIHAHNRRADADPAAITYRLGVNAFSDLNFDEFRVAVGLPPLATTKGKRLDMKPDRARAMPPLERERDSWRTITRWSWSAGDAIGRGLE